MRLLRILLLVLMVTGLPAIAFGQSTVLQVGSWVPGHVPMYAGPSQPIVQDSGPAGGGAAGLGLSELLLAAQGTGSPPYAGQGSGPLGTNFCDYDGPTTSLNGYHYLCFSANAQGGGLITYGASGPATQLPLTLNVNGSSYQFPFTISGIVGPSSTTVNDLACWNNTAGTLLKDCGTLPSLPISVTNGGTGNVSLSGILKGSGTLPVTIAVPGTDYLTPTGNGSGLTGFTSTQITTALGYQPAISSGETLVAAGNSQSTATPLSASFSAHAVSAVALAQGVVLPACASPLGRVDTIVNNGTNQLYAYPASGNTIGIYAPNVPYLINPGMSQRFTCTSAGGWTSDIQPPRTVYPLYVDPNDGALRVDSLGVAVAAFGSTPSATSFDCSSAISFQPSTVGDFTFFYTTKACQVYQIGKMAVVDIQIAGTPTYSTASGTLQINGFPISPALNNSAIPITGVSGFAWPATANGIYGALSGNTIQLSTNRTSSTSTVFTTSSINSGTALSFSLGGSFVTQ